MLWISGLKLYISSEIDALDEFSGVIVPNGHLHKSLGTTRGHLHNHRERQRKRLRAGGGGLCESKHLRSYNIIMWGIIIRKEFTGVGCPWLWRPRTGWHV
jgi:hypothetical protein